MLLTIDKMQMIDCEKCTLCKITTFKSLWVDISAVILTSFIT